MAGEWESGRLADFADVLMGTSPPGETTNETGNGIPLLNGPTEFTGHAPVAVQFTTAPVKLCKPGDILFCVRGSTTGRMNWADQQYAIGRGLAAIRHRDGNKYQPYVRGVIEHALPSLLAVSTGSTFPSVSRPDIENVKVEVPPLREQQAIACVLGSLDDKIELNRRRNHTLEAMARAIFQSWFLDFDPVRAKAEGRDPAGLSKELAALFSKEFEESELGDIPKGWRVRPLPEVCEVNPARSLSKGTVAPYLDMANMPTHGPSPEAWVIREMGSGMKFINGDTLVARITPCLENGKTAFVDFLDDDQVGWGSTEYIVLRPKGAIPPVFAYLLARTEDFRSFAIQQMTGSSGRQRVPADSLTKYHLVTPNLDSELFERFGKLVTPLFQSISANMHQTRTLAALRDVLLPKLISGELRVPDAERIVGRAI